VYIVLRVYVGFCNHYKMFFVWTTAMLALSFWYQTYISGYIVIYWLLADVLILHMVNMTWAEIQFVIAIEGAPGWRKFEDTQRSLLVIIFVELFNCDCHRICAWYDVINRLWVLFWNITCILCIFCVSWFKYGLFTYGQIANWILKKGTRRVAPATTTWRGASLTRTWQLGPLD
jgi:hypothetical protein